MTQQEILSSNLTKTNKMLALFELGLTRREVATLLGVGYGFVQNVYARRYGVLRTRTAALQPSEIGTSEATPWSFTRKFGVEIEAFGCSRNTLERLLSEAGISVETQDYNHRTASCWKLVTDASICGTEAFELVSPPMVGEAGLEELRKVCAVLKEAGIKVNKSCGLHIHFDAQDLNLETWKNLFFNYAAFEPKIDAMLPESRRGANNHFCQSIKQIRTLNRKISLSTDLRSLTNNIAGTSRYFKLNIQSYWRHQTVEFRQHSGTIEFEKISNWIKIGAQMIDFSRAQRARTGSDAEFRAMLQPEQFTYAQQRTEKFARATQG